MLQPNWSASPCVQLGDASGIGYSCVMLGEDRTCNGHCYQVGLPPLPPTKVCTSEQPFLPGHCWSHRLPMLSTASTPLSAPGPAPLLWRALQQQAWQAGESSRRCCLFELLGMSVVAGTGSSMGAAPSCLGRCLPAYPPLLAAAPLVRPGHASATANVPSIGIGIGCLPASPPAPLAALSPVPLNADAP